jgi:hypothetical protein
MSIRNPDDWFGRETAQPPYLTIDWINEDADVTGADTVNWDAGITESLDRSTSPGGCQRQHDFRRAGPARPLVHLFSDGRGRPGQSH